MNQKIILIGTVLVGSALVGCLEPTSSTNIRTTGIVATIEVVADSDSSSTVHAHLTVGGPGGTPVDLEGGDKLTAEADGTSKPMLSEGGGDYEVDFATAADATEFKVMLERTEADENATGNRGVLPAPFKITGVPTDSPSRADSDAVITWDPSGSGDNMEIKVDGSCIFSETFEVAGDPGTFTIGKGKLSSTGGDMPTACDLTVVVSRVTGGTADPGLDPDSSFTLKQVRSDKFTSKP